MRFCLIDFETASQCDLKKCGAWVYASHPSTEILCLGWTWAEGCSVILGQSALAFRADKTNANLEAQVLDPLVTFIAHNVAFEKAIWRAIMVKQYGWPDIPNERWHDTLASCALRVLPLDLDKACTVLRLPFRKDTEGSKFTKGLSKPDKQGNYDRSPESLKRVYDYNRADLDAELGLHNRLGFLPPGERETFQLNQTINERGLCLDLDFIRAGQAVVDQAKEPLLNEFTKITGIEKLLSPKFLDWCNDRGAGLPNMQKETLALVLGGSPDGDEEPDEDDWLTYVKLTPEIERALRIRQLVGSSSIKKLDRMLACVNEDGRSRGLLQYHGTGPGRSSGRLWQPMNLPRGTLKVDGEAPSIEEVVAAIKTKDADYVETLFGPPVESVVSSLRGAIVAGPGRRLVSGDYSGIQARVVLALAGQHDKTALMAAGADVYCDMAKDIYKRPIDKKKDPAERQVGKNSVLGLGFQMGAAKFRFKYGRGLTVEFCQGVVDTYRKVWAPLVPKVWYGLQEAAVRTVWDKTPHEAYGIRYEMEDIWLTARLPSGRKIFYANPKPVRKAMPWDELDIRQAFTYEATKTGQWKTINAFGGQLVENAVMGIEQDLLTVAMKKCEKNNLPIVLEVYDEIVCEPLTKDADFATLKQIMEDVPQWCKAMKIPVEVTGWTGDRYHKE